MWAHPCPWTDFALWYTYCLTLYFSRSHKFKGLIIFWDNLWLKVRLIRNSIFLTGDVIDWGCLRLLWNSLRSMACHRFFWFRISFSLSRGCFDCYRQWLLSFKAFLRRILLPTSIVAIASWVIVVNLLFFRVFNYIPRLSSSPSWSSPGWNRRRARNFWCQRGVYKRIFLSIHKLFIIQICAFWIYIV